MVLDVVSAELERLHERIAGRFVRSEPRRRDQDEGRRENDRQSNHLADVATRGEHPPTTDCPRVPRLRMLRCRQDYTQPQLVITAMRSGSERFPLGFSLRG